jgi:hypothetical protein
MRVLQSGKRVTESALVMYSVLFCNESFFIIADWPYEHVVVYHDNGHHPEEPPYLHRKECDEIRIQIWMGVSSRSSWALLPPFRNCGQDSFRRPLLV